MDVPEVRYAQSGEVSIAYEVVGDGPLDLLLVPGVVSNFDFEWTERRIASFRRRLARFTRLILFDKRGTGLSDQLQGVATLEEQMDDVRAVLAAVGSKRAVVMGISEGTSLAVLFAATYPQQAPGLIIYGGSPHIHTDPEKLERFIEVIPTRWGTRELAQEDLRVRAPSVSAEPAVLNWAERWIRLSASPGAFTALLKMNAEIDIREVLSAIQVPTLVLHRIGDNAIKEERGRELAETIPTASFVQLPGFDHYPWFGEPAPVVAEIKRFLSSLTEEAAFDRVLTTVLVTDIVGSTERAAELVRANVLRFRGRELDTDGDGFLASFDGPARAIRCACAITEAAREVELDARAGLHTGECELLGDTLGGVGVDVGARVAALAQPGEVLVSSSVKDLVAGAGIEFQDRGAPELDGAGERRLFAASVPG